MPFRHKTLAAALLASLAWSAAAQAPKIASIGPEEFVSSTEMQHPSVATDSRAQPHFVCDPGGDTRFMKFHKVNGSWSGGVFAVGSRGGRYDASRLYVGQIEIDPKDRAWISCKFGCKEFGNMLGQGVWLFNNVADTPNPPEQFFRHVNVYKGMGVVTTDAKYPDEGVVIGTFGNWNKLNQHGSLVGSGSLDAGHGGEKVRARIASYAPRFGASAGRNYADGIWHTAMNGSASVDSSYQNSARHNAGLGPVAWADYSTFPEMGDDFHHPGVGIDLTDPRVCYIGQVFGGTMRINIWDGARMLYNPAAPKVIGYGATMEIRHGPSFAPTPSGGSFVFWTSGGRIKTAWLSRKGFVSSITDVTAGRSPAAATDRFGNIHLVYYNRGACYRKIKVSVLQAIEPENRVTATRTPRFRWTNTKASAYTIELTRDGDKLPVHTSTSNSWRPSADLAVGVYSWRVKEGRPAADSPWSRPLSFGIPPLRPEPLAPDSRYPDAPVKPRFRWNATDPAVNRYVIELFRDEVSLGSITTTGTVKVLTAKWTAFLPAGSYSWRMKAERHTANAAHRISSGWTPDMEFQVAVPGPCRIVEPARLAAFPPGWQAVTCSWTKAAGAATYKLNLLFNGVKVEELTTPATFAPVSKAFQPGYYALVVKPKNDSGSGPWSPIRTFIVRRQMEPGGSITLANPPQVFEWTRSKNATRYLVKLSRYDRTARKYRIEQEKWVAQPGQGPVAWDPVFTFTRNAYRWSVTDYTGREQGYTSAAYFQVGVPGRPLLLSPGGPVAGHRMLAFSWEDPSAFAEEFQLQIWKGKTKARDSGWLRAIDLKADPTVFTKFYSFDETDAGNYTWLVRGRNDTGTGPWQQNAYSLTPLAAPVFKSPANNAHAEANVPLTFSWAPVDHATKYQVQILQGAATAALDVLSDTNWLWTPPAGSYTVRLRAGETGWSGWTLRTFTAAP